MEEVDWYQTRVENPRKLIIHNTKKNLFRSKIIIPNVSKHVNFF